MTQSDYLAKELKPFLRESFLVWIQGDQIFWTATVPLQLHAHRSPYNFTFRRSAWPFWMKAKRSGPHEALCIKTICLPLFVGLRKKGATTAMPSAPISAACRAFKRRKKTITGLVTISMSVGWGVVSPHQQAILWYQLHVLQFYSTLILSTWRQSDCTGSGLHLTRLPRFPEL